MCASRNDLELYIHIPFCIRKCNYCDFLSFPSKEEEREVYIESLINEIKQTGKILDTNDYKVRSIFIGGGTPSLLSGEQMERIMQAVRESFAIKDGAEITMEANPGTLTEANIFSYKKAGVNRLSMGLQSADDACLHLLGRIHTWEEFLKSYELARKAGFENINIDLMSGLPGQTIEIYKKTLEKVMALRPEHISAYSLILEEGTPFGESKEIQRKIPDEETDREMYQLTKDVLLENGYERYEISNYAIKGKECIHNLGYWSGTPYLGFGLGASSYFEGTRFSNEKDLEKYKKKPYVPFMMREDYTVLSEKDEMEEFMFLGLRKRAGISEREFKERFKVGLKDIYGKVIAKYEEMDLLEWTDEGKMLRLTDAGIDVSDYIFCDFML